MIVDFFDFHIEIPMTDCTVRKSLNQRVLHGEVDRNSSLNPGSEQVIGPVRSFNKNSWAGAWLTLRDEDLPLSLRCRGISKD
jgi:hypothetical protein